MPAKPRPHSPEDDLAFMRSIVEGGGRPSLTLSICYLAGGLLYGTQCLFHVGQVTGVIRWPDLANLAFVVAISAAFLSVLTWAILKDRRDGAARGPLASRSLNAAFSVAATMLSVMMSPPVSLGFAGGRGFHGSLRPAPSAPSNSVTSTSPWQAIGTL